MNIEQNFCTIEDEPWSCILSHTLGDYPEEACGILLGPGERPYHITEAHPARNVTSEDSTAGYLVDPVKILDVQKWAEQRQLDICGFYHSHPDHPCVPSEYDRRCAWEGYLYLILSIKDGVFERSGAWSWDPGNQQFTEVVLRSRLHRRKDETFVQVSSM